MFFKSQRSILGQNFNFKSWGDDMADFLRPDVVVNAYGLEVKQYFITDHNVNKISLPSKRVLPLLGITLHNTDDINEARQTTDPEQYVRSTVNGNMGTVRVHFYVDDDECWQMLPLDYQSWHAGQRGKYDQWGSEAGNAQTISIECIMDGSGSEKDKRAEDNAARLIAWLLDQFGMTTANLYTHNYWCNVRNGKKGTIDELNKLNDGYKNCPIYIRPHWDEFLKKVRGYMQTLTTEKSDYLYRVCVGTYSIEANARERLKEVKKVYPDAFLIKTVRK